MIWTEQMLTRLYHLCRKTPALSFATIVQTMNEELGLTLTKNAVIGKAHRMKTGKQPFTPRLVVLPPKIDAPIAPPLAPLIPGLGLTIYQTNHNTCKWPNGDRPPYLYCGHRVHAGEVYCKRHCEMAYATPRMRWE